MIVYKEVSLTILVSKLVALLKLYRSECSDEALDTQCDVLLNSLKKSLKSNQSHL